MKTTKMMKKLLLVMFLMVGFMQSYADRTPFISKWETATDAFFRLPVSGTSYKVQLDITASSDATEIGKTVLLSYSGGAYTVVDAGGVTGITFAVNSDYTPASRVTFAGNQRACIVTIYDVSNDFYFQFNNRGGRTRLLEIQQWGSEWVFGINAATNANISSIFYGCSNLQVTATDMPLLKGSMAAMFRGCTALTGNSSFGNWDLSQVTTVENIFNGASNFNINIGNWNTQNVTAMNSAFDGASKFNQALNWSLKSVTTINAMLKAEALSCENFTYTLRNWADDSDTPSGLVLGNTTNSFGVVGGLRYGDQAAYTTLIGKGWDLTNTTYNAACGGILPVTFAGLTASLANGELSVQWKTVSEQNNDKFIIQLSKDGKNWQNVATVNSKAENGNSTTPLEYEHTITYNVAQLASMPVFFTLLLVVLLTFRRRKHLLISMTLLSGVFFVGCNKNDLFLRSSGSSNNNLYARIQQVDKDGKTTSSDVVLVKQSK